jgi:chromosome segregation ATPase
MGPELTPEEQAHQKSLETLLESMRAASADPATSIAAREVLQPQISALEDQLDDLEAGVFSRDTVDIEAQEQALDPALAQLKALKAELAKVAAGIKTAGQIAGYVDTAISTCESLLG